MLLDALRSDGARPASRRTRRGRRGDASADASVLLSTPREKEVLDMVSSSRPGVRPVSRAMQSRRSRRPTTASSGGSVGSVGRTASFVSTPVGGGGRYGLSDDEEGPVEAGGGGAGGGRPGSSQVRRGGRTCACTHSHTPACSPPHAPRSPPPTCPH